MSRGIFLKTASLLDVPLHGAVMSPAALPLDLSEVRASAIGASCHASPQAVT